MGQARGGKLCHVELAQHDGTCCFQVFYNRGIE